MSMNRGDTSVHVNGLYVKTEIYFSQKMLESELSPIKESEQEPILMAEPIQWEPEPILTAKPIQQADERQCCWSERICLA